VEASDGDGSKIVEAALWVSRAQIASGDETGAYEALATTLESVETRFGHESRASLELLCAMGEEYATRGQLVLAESLYREAASRRSSYAPALLGLARTLRRAGSDLDAVEQYEQVLRLEPDNDSAREELKALLAVVSR
jgi:tetratricopeptide (TPR) repeat protein